MAENGHGEEKRGCGESDCCPERGAADVPDDWFGLPGQSVENDFRYGGSPDEFSVLSDVHVRYAVLQRIQLRSEGGAELETDRLLLRRDFRGVFRRDGADPPV